MDEQRIRIPLSSPTTRGIRRNSSHAKKESAARKDCFVNPQMSSINSIFICFYLQYVWHTGHIECRRSNHQWMPRRAIYLCFVSGKDWAPLFGEMDLCASVCFH